jgi:hypothetical protein
MRRPKRGEVAEEAPLVVHAETRPKLLRVWTQPIDDRSPVAPGGDFVAGSLDDQPDICMSETLPRGIAIEQGSVRVGKCAAGSSPWREMAESAAV